MANLKEYETPANGAEYEYSEKRSTFTARLKPVQTEEEAKAFIEGIRKRFPDARHHVWAYVLPDGTLRSSDDGEPAGTGGAPVTDAVAKRGLCGCVIVVTRYFGGILLGTGGLVHAYSTAAAGAVEKAGRVWVRAYTEISVTCSYAQYGAVSRLASRSGARSFDAQFGSEVTAKFLLPSKDTGRFEKELTEAFSGRLAALVGEEVFLRE
ncbi:MAG: YigZ family protein [Clostridia bacterium]|nr:YigZ family protein [Clostridia bacterium]